MQMFFYILFTLLCGLYFAYRVQFKTQECTKSLQGKTVLITGPTSGLGKALAFAFHRLGSNLHLCSRNIQELENIKREMLELNDQVKINVHSLDLSKTDTIADFVEKVCSEKDEKIDIVINNAGLRFRGKVKDTSHQVFKQFFDVNFFAQVALTHSFLKYFVQRNIPGHIVGIGSIQSKLSTPYRAPYSSSKHACQAYYDAVRAEMDPYNIKITVVNPGYIKTHSSKNAILSDGSVSGKPDKDDDKGMDVDKVASRIITAIANNEKEVTIAPFYHKIAMFIRLLDPDLYFRIMKNRVKSSV